MIDLCPTGVRSMELDEMRHLPLATWMAMNRHHEHALGRHGMAAHFEEALADIELMGLLKQAEAVRPGEDLAMRNHRQSITRESRIIRPAVVTEQAQPDQPGAEAGQGDGPARCHLRSSSHDTSVCLPHHLPPPSTEPEPIPQRKEEPSPTSTPASASLPGTLAPAVPPSLGDSPPTIEGTYCFLRTLEGGLRWPRSPEAQAHQLFCPVVIPPPALLLRLLLPTCQRLSCLCRGQCVRQTVCLQRRLPRRKAQP